MASINPSTNDPPNPPHPTSSPSLASQDPGVNPANFRAEDFAADNKTHILLAATGSVATIKLPLIITGLAVHPNITIRIILTHSATHFLSGSSPETPSLTTLRSLPHVQGIYTDADEWFIPWQRGNPILHIELRKWADIMLVAPLDANTLAKMTCGISDNLLLSVLRAWDPDGAFNPLGRVGRQKWLGVAPAMNTAMWLHPVTKGQIRVLEVEWGDDGDGGKRTWAKVLKPVEKELACGDRGVGAMMDWRDIVEEVLEQVRKFD